MAGIWLAKDQRANLCIGCGECLDKCPQRIEIPDWLAKAHKALCREEAAKFSAIYLVSYSWRYTRTSRTTRNPHPSYSSRAASR
jgi:ferredoxin